MRLNLGAGNEPITSADCINHDLIKHRAEIAVAHDLNVRPWPWKDGAFEQVLAKSVFEHLSIDLVQALDECWRILAKGGVLYCKVPMWNAPQAYQDPQHRWRWAPGVFDYFDPDTPAGKEYSYYTPRKWQIAKRDITGTAIHVTLRVRK